jgi:hypothetical protein
MAVAKGVTDFRGLRVECASCHMDVHQNELGANCQTCHTARSFQVPTFVHARQRAFFDGQHRTLGCVDCHRPSAAPPAPAPVRAAAPPATRAAAASAPRMSHVGLTRTSEACVSCHQDVHAGQLGTRCDTCHTVQTPKFAVASFAHERTRFPLTGKHAPLACDVCHKMETRSFPTGSSTTRRFAGIGVECATCHQDPHAGQLTQGCQSCHSSETFRLTRYTHLRAQPLRSFFAGEHLSAPCAACHKPTVVRAGLQAAAAYRTSTTCTDCHADVHRGALGPRCETCHRP